MLDQIISHKHEVVTSRASEINAYKNTLRPSNKSLFQAIKNYKKSFICEIKPASPSQGLIRKNIDISEVARIYEPFALRYVSFG